MSKIIAWLERHGWIADDPCPVLSQLDRWDGAK